MLHISIINLDKLLNNSDFPTFKLNPHDTIYIDETLDHLLADSNVINILLQITNLILISTNNRYHSNGCQYKFKRNSLRELFFIIKATYQN